MQQSIERTEQTPNLDHNPIPLVKQRTTTTAAEAIDFFQKNIEMISPYMKNDLIKWVNDVEQPLVMAAMKRTLERGKVNLGYIKAILRNWLDKGIKTIKDTEMNLQPVNR